MKRAAKIMQGMLGDMDPMDFENVEAVRAYFTEENFQSMFGCVTDSPADMEAAREHVINLIRERDGE